MILSNPYNEQTRLAKLEQKILELEAEVKELIEEKRLEDLE